MVVEVLVLGLHFHKVATLKIPLYLSYNNRKHLRFDYNTSYLHKQV